MIQNLIDIQYKDINRFGRKASALGKLMQSGVNVPEGYALSEYKTKNSTKVLKDGDIVELDGVKGEVRVL